MKQLKLFFGCGDIGAKPKAHTFAAGTAGTVKLGRARLGPLHRPVGVRPQRERTGCWKPAMKLRRRVMKRWSAVISHSRASGKPPQTAQFDSHDALRTYLESASEVVLITIFRSVECRREPLPCSGPARLPTPQLEEE
jgi:hypothetical protein